MKEKNRELTVALIVVLALGLSCAGKKPLGLAGKEWSSTDNNLHQVDGPAAGKSAPEAFRVYRSGSPTKETFAKWCSDYKIGLVIDMAGTAKDHELAFQEKGICPKIKVIYTEKQNPNKPATEEFLNFFDAQIAKARKDGKGILFRCTTGSHRTGRLAAYYQMKYMGLEPPQAIDEMNRNGVLMPVYETTLVRQIYALHDYLHSLPCSQREGSCVKK